MCNKTVAYVAVRLSPEKQEHLDMESCAYSRAMVKHLVEKDDRRHPVHAEEYPFQRIAKIEITEVEEITKRNLPVAVASESKGGGTARKYNIISVIGRIRGAKIGKRVINQ